MQERVLLGLRSYAAARLFTQIASWLGTVYVVRQLDSRALGEYGVALVVFNYLSMIYDGTLVEALVQRPPQPGAERRALFTVLVGIGLTLAAATMGFAGLIGRLVGDPGVPPLLAAVALVLVLTSFCVLPHAALAREMAFNRLASIGAVQAVCVTCTSVVLAYLGAGAWALALGLMAGTAARTVLLNVGFFGLALPTTRIAPALRYLRFGGVLFADNVLWRWYTSLDTVLLSRWVGTTSLGFYGLAQQVAELPLEKIATVVNDVSLPAYARLGDSRGAGQLMLETIRSHATLGFPVFWGIAVVAPYLVPVVFGGKWDLAIFPLVALAAVAPLRLIGSIETPAMTGVGRPGILLKTKLVVAPCMTLALIVGCRAGGIDGAALAWLCVFPVSYGFAFRYGLRTIGISYALMLAAIRGPAASAAVMVIVVLAWSRLAVLLSPAPLFGLVFAILAGAIAYPGALRLIDPGAYQLGCARIGRLVGLRQPAR